MKIENFNNWEDAEPAEDFFSDLDSEQETTGTSAEEVIEKLKETKPAKTKVKAEVEEVEEEEESPEDLFGAIEDADNVEEVDKDEEEEDTTKPSTKTSTVDTLSFLKEKGLVSFELEEEAELTEELAEEILEDSFEEKISAASEERIKDLPADVKAIVSFALKGGNLTDYLQQNYSSEVDLEEDIDLSSEANQIRVLQEILLEELEDEEAVETQIEFLKDSAKLKKFAETKYKKYLADRQKLRDDAVRLQEEKNERVKQDIRKAKKTVQTLLGDSNSFEELEFSKEVKESLPSFMNDKTVKLQNGVMMTEMQKELFAEVPKNEKTMIQLAILLKNRNKDGTFNFDAVLLNGAKTKFTKDTKDKVRRMSSTNKTSNKSTKSLADLFST